MNCESWRYSWVKFREKIQARFHEETGASVLEFIALGVIFVLAIMVILMVIMKKAN